MISIKPLTIGLALAIYAGVSLSSVSVCGAADAQPNEMSVAARVEQFYNAGLEAANQGRWPEAAESFAAAWELDKHFQIAGALGRAELRCGRYRDAAEHLDAALRLGKGSLKAPDKKALEGWFDEASAHVGAVTVTMNVEGAAMKVAGRNAGASPLDHPVFVDPGTSTIEASRAGYDTARASINAQAGQVYAITVTLAKSSDIGKGSSGTDLGRSASQRNGLLIAGIATAGLGIVGGLVFFGLSVSKDAPRESLRATLTSKGFDPDSGCMSPGMSSNESCKTLRGYYDAENTFGNAAVWVAASGVLIGGGMILGHFLTKPKKTVLGDVSATAVVTAQGGALVLTGAW